MFSDINEVYQRPCTTDGKLNDKMKPELCATLDVSRTDFDELSFNYSWKNKQVFVYIGNPADLKVFLHECVLGKFVAIPHDSDSFVESGEVTGFRIWNSWLGLYEQKDLKSVTKVGDLIRRMLSGVESRRS